MDQPTVDLDVRGNLLKVTPDSGRYMAYAIDLVKRTCTFRRKSFERGKLVFVNEMIATVNEDGTIVTFAGLHDRIVTALKAANYKITTQRSKLPELKLDMNQMDHKIKEAFLTRPVHMEALGLVIDSPQSFIIEAPTAWGKTYMMSYTCKLLPYNTIALVMSGRDMVMTMRDRLKAMHVPDVCFCGAGGNSVGRITVTTAQSLEKLKGTQWDLLLFDEVHKAGSPKLTEIIPEVFPNTKCVGLSASPEGRSDGSDLWIEALFGPVLFKSTYKEAEDRGEVSPINVVMINVPHGPTIDPGTAMDVLSRRGIWRNEERNRLIASIASSISASDEQILITVGTAEHALFLHELLPNFEVVFSTVSNKHIIKKMANGDFGEITGVSPGGVMSNDRREELRVGFESGEIKRVIATGIWNVGVSFNKLSCLIRADAFGSDILSTQTPGRLSRLDPDKKCGTLIDFCDEFNRTLMNRALSREKSYRAKGWKVEKRSWTKDLTTF